jgi:4-amino-4-deoxy-L-arabinose transferase-like glycosyltransferase
VYLLEFPLYQAVAALLIDAGIQMEVALRGLSLLCFMGTAGVLWLLMKRHVNERAGLIALLVFLFSPFALLWSRTSMIEYPATLGAVLFMFGTLEWHAGRGRRWFALAAVGGSIAALIKLSTAVFWVAPALLTRRAGSLLLCAIPAAFGIAWTLYAGARRAETPLVSGFDFEYALHWYMGGDRHSLTTWLGVLLPTLVWVSMLLLPFALVVIHRSERLVWAWLAVALVGPMLVFTPMYAMHDYYAAAVSPAVAGLVGGGLDRVLVQAGRHGRLVAGGFAALAIGVLIASNAYWTRMYGPHDPNHVLEGAAIVRAATNEGEYVDLGCASWNTEVMFCAERKGFAAFGDGSGYTRFDDPRVCVDESVVWGVSPG